MPDRTELTFTIHRDDLVERVKVDRVTKAPPPTAATTDQKYEVGGATGADESPRDATTAYMETN